MAFTVKKLAQLSGVSVRTLHFYDEVGLLKPAYYGTNGYRYYEEDQLLWLQQILFFRELGFELKQIQKVLGRGDFDKLVALSSHRQVLYKNLERTRSLIKTIDKTVEHLKGTKKMKEQDMYKGFSKEKQAEYENQLIERFGAQAKTAIAECKENIRNWKKPEWDKSTKEFEEICKELVLMQQKKCKAGSKDAQSLIRRHYHWLNRFWTPTKESYAAHAQLIVDSDLRKAYETYNPELPEFVAEAIRLFAERELQNS